MNQCQVKVKFLINSVYDFSKKYTLGDIVHLSQNTREVYKDTRKKRSIFCALKNIERMSKYDELQNLVQF